MALAEIQPALSEPADEGSSLRSRRDVPDLGHRFPPRRRKNPRGYLDGYVLLSLHYLPVTRPANRTINKRISFCLLLRPL